MTQKHKYGFPEQEHFQTFILEGKVYDLSHLDSHKVEYIHQAPAGSDRPDITYTFYVTYSMHCFAKHHKNQCPIEAEEQMYHARKESSPFCFRRYELSKNLPGIIKNLPNIFNFHAGYDSYAVCPLENGEEYFIAFSAFREKKKLRLHIMSAYPLDKQLGKRKKVNFFSIASALQSNKRLPRKPK